jgi:hypothetical protein
VPGNRQGESHTTAAVDTSFMTLDPDAAATGLDELANALAGKD